MPKQTFEILKSIRGESDLLNLVRLFEKSASVKTDASGNLEISDGKHTFRSIFVNDGAFAELELYVLHAYADPGGIIAFYDLLPNDAISPNLVVIYSTGTIVMCQLRRTPDYDAYGDELDISHIKNIPAILTSELQLLKTPIIAANKFDELQNENGKRIRTIKEILDITGTGRFQRTIIFTTPTPEILRMNLTYDIDTQNFYNIGTSDNLRVPFNKIIVEWKNVYRYRRKFDPAGFRNAANPENANPRPNCILLRIINGDLRMRIYSTYTTPVMAAAEFKTADEIGGDARYVDGLKIKKAF